MAKRVNVKTHTRVSKSGKKTVVKAHTKMSPYDQRKFYNYHKAQEKAYGELDENLHKQDSWPDRYKARDFNEDNEYAQDTIDRMHKAKIEILKKYQLHKAATRRAIEKHFDNKLWDDENKHIQKLKKAQSGKLSNKVVKR